MQNYTQITRDERVIIADLWKRDKSYYYIANWLKRKYDTIRNEIERNGEINQFGKLIYTSRKANKKYLSRRRKSKRDSRIIENNIKVERRIIELITEDQLSPEEISGRYKTVSHQTIYDWIYRMSESKTKRDLISNLRRSGKKYRRTKKTSSFQSIIAPKTMINERPCIIEQRERLGDFEGDTVLLNGLERLYTLVDRKSGYLLVRHILNGYAQTIYEETLKIYKANKVLIESITYDNGVEFAYHDLITADTKIPIYFCYPYHSWERGSNENTNGLIRQYLPKGAVHGKITESDIKTIEDKLNNRPRKRLNYLTPHEVFVLKMKPENFQVQALI